MHFKITKIEIAKKNYGDKNILNRVTIDNNG